MIKAIGSKYNIIDDEKTREYYLIIKDLLDDDVVILMKKFHHHCNISCFQHCINVSYYNYILCKKFNLDFRAASRGGMLHDLFLYDWKTTKRKKGEQFHAFSHGRTALKNAKERFLLSKREENMIASHMFPLSNDLPKYKESLVIVLVDKYCAMAEIFSYLKRNIINQLKLFFIPSLSNK